MTKLGNCLESVSIYVGTYRKYNEGSIFGKWLKLSDYADYNSLVEAMKELHKDEEDPEFMIQDFESIGVFSKLNLISECSISENIYEIAEQIDNSDYDAEIIEAYLDCTSEHYNDVEELLSKISDSYLGEYNSDEEFAQNLLEDCGSIPKDLPSFIHIDWESTARDLMFDYMASNGYYFRC